MSIGDTENKLCMSIDIKNDELPTLFIKNLTTDKFYYEQIKNGSSAEFVNQDRHILYVSKDPQSYRDSKIVVHNVGDNFLEEDFTIFEELDEQNWINLELSSCKKWLNLIQVSKDGYGHYICKKSDFEILSSSSLSPEEKKQKLESSFIKVADKQDGVREMKINESGIVLQMADDSIHFINLEVLEEFYSSQQHSEAGTFVENFEPRQIFNPKSIQGYEDLVITDFDFYNAQVILYCQKVTESRILQIDLTPLIESDSDKNVLPQVRNMVFGDNQLGTIHPYPNNDTSSKNIRFHFSSPYSAEILYSLSLPELYSEQNTVTKVVDVAPEVRILSQLDRGAIPNFEAKIIEVPSSDEGISIPVTFLTPVKAKFGLFNSIFGSKTTTSAYENFQSDKLLIKSYGCYGLSSYLEYSPSDLYLLSQGYSIAYAHIRGGSERGSEWHEAARKEKKYKSVQDLEDVISHFRANSSYSNLSKLGATGNLVNFPAGIFAESDSAGATLLMSMVNQNPGLLDGVVLSAPFLNLKTLEDETQALSQSDWLEFGQWTNPIEAEVLNQLCPLSQLEYILDTKHYEQTELNYPPIYIQAYSGDYRTPLWTIVDYVKKFRQLNKKILDQQSQLVQTKKSKFSSIAIALNIKEGSHKGSSGDSFAEMSEKIAFIEWLSEDLVQRSTL